MQFNRNTPSIIVVDNFYQDPDAVVEYANKQPFVADERYFKGVRSDKTHLFPYVKEEFERIMQVSINGWMTEGYNGVFQKTNKNNPIVWHSDSQRYAAAIYLTRDADDLGTSFWKDKKYGCRRAPNDEAKCSEIYSEYNLLHPDNWELVDKVGGVYNRLVIWDAKLIHSASMYSEKERLVQLFFFN